jgi:CDP-6-deoxy-D-xylo-4-hexulose-3-dehydrase|tara:strand:- start:240 stop:698 length:459 start_codon:yes stop_codon:yes gene_type:complete
MKGRKSCRTCVSIIINGNPQFVLKDTQYLLNLSKAKRMHYISYFKMPLTFKDVKTAWLAFPLLIKKNKKFSRRDLQIFFEKNNIQTRNIFTGNILKQPAMKNKIYKISKNAEAVSNDVMKNGILIGCHQGLTFSDIKYIFKVFNKFAKINNL